MSIMKPVPQRRCINYKKVEAPVYYKMETKLCEELGITYSELHKQSVRRLFNARQLELVWIMKQVKVNPVNYQILLELSKKAHKSPENFLGDLLAEKYQEKK